MQGELAWDEITAQVMWRASVFWWLTLSLPNSAIMLTLSLLVANLVIRKWCENYWKMTALLGNRYSTLQELSNEYQHDRVKMIFMFSLLFCALDESDLSSRWVKPECFGALSSTQGYPSLGCVLGMKLLHRLCAGPVFSDDWHSHSTSSAILV